MENEPEQLTKPDVKKQTELSNFGDVSGVTVSYQLSMCLDGQSAKVDFGVTLPCLIDVADCFDRAEKICADVLPEKLKELQELVCHLKNTKNRIEAGDLKPLKRVDDAS